MIYQTLTFKNKEITSKKVFKEVIKGAQLWNNVSSFNAFDEEKNRFGTIILKDKRTGNEKGGIFYYFNPAKELTYRGIRCDGFLEYIMEYPKETHADITDYLSDICHIHTGGEDKEWWD